MKRGFIYNLVLTVGNTLFPIITFPYASHVLGPAGIGKVQFAISFAQYFALIAALGIPVYGVSQIAQVRGDAKKTSQIFSELLFINIISSVILASVYAIIVCSVPLFKNEQRFFLLAGIIILTGFSLIDWFYSGLEDFKGIAVRSIFIKLVSLGLLFVFVKSTADYGNYLLIMIFSFTGSNALSFLMLYKRINFVFPGKAILRHVKPSLAIFSTTIATSMYTILDSVLLGFLSNEKAVGLYTAAVKLTKITLPVVISLGVVLIPKIARSLSQGDFVSTQSYLDKSFNFLAMVSVPIVIGTATLAPEFIEVFSGGDFRDANRSMQILSCLPLLVGFGHFFAFQILVPGKRSKEMLYSVIAGVVVALSLNFILVPAFAHTGAAIANVCSEITVTILYFYFVNKYYTFKYEWVQILKALGGSALFIPIIWFTRESNLGALYTLICSVIICSLTYLLVQIFCFKDRLLLNFIRSFSYKI